MVMTDAAGLDKALLSIAANYAKGQKIVGGGGGGGGSGRPSFGSHSHSAGSGGGVSATNTQQRANMWWNKKGKMPTDPSQWKYCELCKMTCPGPQVSIINERSFLPIHSPPPFNFCQSFIHKNRNTTG